MLTAAKLIMQGDIFDAQVVCNYFKALLPGFKAFYHDWDYSVPVRCACARLAFLLLPRLAIHRPAGTVYLANFRSHFDVGYNSL
ncbi:MAG TPA: hypothetical protein DDW87_11710 [Firmicutes bacterium]|nr:hypothetical protein [Bacillota bacterium]